MAGAERESRNARPHPFPLPQERENRSRSSSDASALRYSLRFRCDHENRCECNRDERTIRTVDSPSLSSGALRYPQLPHFRGRIPKGFRHKAQGCEGRATLGQPSRRAPTPTGLRHERHDRSHNPVGVETFSTPISQGSSSVATLGWRTQSLWDWLKSAPKIWVMISPGEAN